MGNTRVRPPRLEFEGKELEDIRKLVKGSLKTRPRSASTEPIVSVK
jgi:hypothetical protein